MLTKDTEAWIANANVTADGDVTVQATSSEKVTSISASVALGGEAGIAGSAGVSLIDVTTRAFIGKDPDNSTAGAADVLASGSILVQASEATIVNAISGNFSAGGTASVGLGVTVPIITKTTESFIGAGANVTALGLGGGVDADDGKFIISFAPYDTTAGVAQVPTTTQDLTGSGDNSLNSPRLGENRIATPESLTVHGLAVTAVNTDALQGVGVDGGVSGTVSVNLSGSVAVLTNSTNAFIGAARPSTPLRAQALGRAVGFGRGRQRHLVPGRRGALSLSGSVSVTPGAVVLVINNTTKAQIKAGAQVYARGDIDVEAHNSGDILTVAATASGGIDVGVGIAVSYIGVNDTTLASIGDTGDAGTSLASAGGDVLVDASDDTVAFIVSGSLGIGVTGAGIGASVGITMLNKTTKAYIGAGATVNALGNSAGLSDIYNGNYDSDSDSYTTAGSFHGVAVQATSSENVTNIAVAGGVGTFVGLAGAFSVEVFNSTTQAFVGDGAHVNVDSTGAGSEQSVNVAAFNQATHLSVAGGVGGGIAGLAGGVDIGVLKNSTQAYIGNNADVRARKDVNVYALSDDDVESYALGGALGAVAVVGSVSVWSIGVPYTEAGQSYSDDGAVSDSIDDTKLQDQTGKAEGQTAGASSALSSLTDSSKNGATGNTQYIGDHVTDAKNQINGSVRGNESYDAIYADLPTDVPTGTVAFIGQGANVTAGGNVDVGARSKINYDAIAGGVSAGLVGVGAAIVIANIQGNTQAYIDSDATVSAVGDVTVDADLVQDNVNGSAYAGYAGIAAVGGQVVVLNDTSTESAAINSGAAHFAGATGGGHGRVESRA